jgi:hypothetical protein
VFNHPSVIPSVVDLTKVHHVLDAAAGTAAWALDLSDRAEAKSLNIHVCDITASKFPPKEVLARAGISAFEHDLLQPFPEQMQGMFDLVNLAYVWLVFKEDQWGIVLRNLYNALGESSQ